MKTVESVESDKATDVEVRDADKAWANDIWNLTSGEKHNSRRVWRRNGNPKKDQICWEGGEWQLRGSGTLFYQADGDTPTPPLSGWKAAGQASALTVRYRSTAREFNPQKSCRGTPLRAADMPRIVMIRLRLWMENGLLALAHESEEESDDGADEATSAWTDIVKTSSKGRENSHKDWESTVQNGLPHPCLAVGLLVGEVRRRMSNSLREFLSAATRVRAAHVEPGERRGQGNRVPLREFQLVYDLFCRHRALVRMSIADNRDILSEFFIELDSVSNPPSVRSTRHFELYLEPLKQEFGERNMASVFTSSRSSEKVKVYRAEGCDPDLTFELNQMHDRMRTEDGMDGITVQVYSNVHKVVEKAPVPGCFDNAETLENGGFPGRIETVGAGTKEANAIWELETDETGKIIVKTRRKSLTKDAEPKAEPKDAVEDLAVWRRKDNTDDTIEWKDHKWRLMIGGEVLYEADGDTPTPPKYLPPTHGWRTPGGNGEAPVVYSETNVLVRSTTPRWQAATLDRVNNAEGTFDVTITGSDRIPMSMRRRTGVTKEGIRVRSSFFAGWKHPADPKKVLEFETNAKRVHKVIKNWTKERMFPTNTWAFRDALETLLFMLLILSIALPLAGLAIFYEELRAAQLLPSGQPTLFE